MPDTLMQIVRLHIAAVDIYDDLQPRIDKILQAVAVIYLNAGGGWALSCAAEGKRSMIDPWSTTIS